MLTAGNLGSPPLGLRSYVCAVKPLRASYMYADLQTCQIRPQIRRVSGSALPREGERPLRLTQRQRSDLTRFAKLGGDLAAELNVESVVLDGEVIAADETGRPLFYDLVRSARRHRDFSG